MTKRNPPTKFAARMALRRACHERSNVLVYGALVALWLFHAFVNVWWLQTDKQLPRYDMAGHAARVLYLLHAPLAEHWAAGDLHHVLLQGPYPPFFHWMSLPFAWLIAPTVDVLTLVNVLFLGLLLFTTYAVAVICANPYMPPNTAQYAGLLAACLVSFYPIIYGISRQFLFETALAAMTTAVIGCLLWSDGLRRRRPSIWLGVAVGFGMLTKWTLAVFVAGPCLVVAILLVRPPRRVRRLNLLLAVGIASAIAGPWYLYNLRGLSEFLAVGGFRAAVLEGDPVGWHWATWRYYLAELTATQMLLPLTLLAGVGGWLILRTTWRQRKLDLSLYVLLAWIALPYAAFSLYDNKDERYTIPYLPAFAVLTAVGIMQIRRPGVRRLLISVTMVYALVQFAGLTVGLRSVVPVLQQWLPTDRIEIKMAQIPLTFYAESVHVATPPRTIDWHATTIVDDILADVATREDGAQLHQLLVVPATQGLDGSVFRYLRWAENIPLEIETVTGITEVDSAASLKRADYVLTKTGEQGPAWVVQDAADITAQLQSPDSPLADEFVLLKTYALPDGSTAFLYRRADVRSGNKRSMSTHNCLGKVLGLMGLETTSVLV